MKKTVERQLTTLAQRLILPALAWCALLSPAHAQCTSWAEGFGVEFPDGPVKALVSFDDGSGEKLYVGGNYSMIGERTIPFLATWDGHDWSAVGSGYFDGQVAAFFVHDFGQGPRLVVGGEFSTAGGVSANRVAIWDGTSWSALGLGFDDIVLSFHGYDDGSGFALYAGGAFTHSGAALVSRIAKWNGASWLPVGGGVNSVVHAFETFDPGSGPRLYVGGEFSLAGGAPVGHIASWDGSAWSALGSGVGAAVNALSVFTPPSTGIARLYVGGEFLDAGGAHTQYLASWTGSSWSTFQYLSQPVQSLLVYDEGIGARLYVAGAFDGIGFNRVARCDGFAFSALGQGPRLFTAYALASFDSGGGPRLYAGGQTGSSNGANLFAWDSASWIATGSANGLLTFGASSATQVRALTEADLGTGSRLYACGDFTQAGDVTAFGIAGWDGVRWSPLGSGIQGGVGIPANVYAIGSYDDGTGPALYAGGYFFYAGGLPVSRIARWNGSVWSAVGAGISSSVYSFAVFDDGTGPALYVGGYISGAGGQPANGIARWNGSTWSTLSTGVGGPVYSLCVHDDGSGPALYAGGSFSTAGGQPASNIARWNGTSWSALGSGVDSDVIALGVHDDGSGPALYAGGAFTTAGGQPASRIARWDGANWSAFSTGMNGNVNTLSLFDDGSGPALYAGGEFTFAGGTSAVGIAKWNGISWSSVLGSLTSSVSFYHYVLGSKVWDDGTGNGPSLWIGGAFGSVGGVESRSIAALRGCRITSFCAGDGIDPAVTTPCPCGNFGTQGHGCAWHNGPNGALLAASGRIAPDDELVLTASSMPLVAPSTIFLKGDQIESAGSVVFGDGVRCAGGSLIRLGSKMNVNGVARFPESGNVLISVRGQTPPGSGLIGHYQTYYRNAASFCTSATFNVTNGVKVVW